MKLAVYAKQAVPQHSEASDSSAANDTRGAEDVAAGPNVQPSGFVFYDEQQLLPTAPSERQGGMPRLVADLRAATSPGERERLVRGMLHAIGFEWMGYGTMLHLGGEVIPRSFFTSYTHPSWSGYYFSERYFEVDPRHHDAPCSGLPLVWDLQDIDKSLLSRTLQGKSKRFLEDFRESGIRSGIFFSLASASQSNERTVISLLSTSANRRWIVDGILGQALTLGLSVHEFLTRHTHITRPNTPSKAGLSALQQDILQCLIRGLSDKEIAHCLNLSSYNVDYHLRQLRRRFCARNRVQLVSAAMAATHTHS